MSADDASVRNRDAQAAADRASTYEWGFTSDIEQDFAPKGLSEDTVRFISAKKNEPEWMLDWRLKAYRAWLTMEEPDWAKLDIPPIDYPGRLLLRRAQGEAEARLARRARSRDPARLREARHPDRGAEGARRRRGRAQGRGRRGVRQRLGRHHLPRRAEDGRGHLPLDQRGDPRISRAGPQISRQGGAAARQLFRLPELRGLLRRHLRLHPRGRALPDGAVAPISGSMPRIPASSSAP